MSESNPSVGRDERSPDGPAQAAGPRHARLNERVMLEDVARRMFGGPSVNKVRMGRYILLDKVGSGGMGTVYRAYDPRLQRRIALKVLRADAVNGPKAKARLRREAVALAALSHPNVVTIHEVGDSGDEVFVAMEYVEGLNLAQWASANALDGPRRQQLALGLLVQAARGLAAAHRAGLVHRDVKPPNILVGQTGRACIADFGLVRRTEQVSSESGPRTPGDATPGAGRSRSAASLGGTPRYASPEQSSGGVVDARSDQFSWCVTAWEVLFGALPWEGDPSPDGPPQAPRGAPRRLVEALRTGLDADPDRRHDSIERLIEVLTWKPWRRWLGLAGVLLVAVGVAGYARQQATRCDPGDAPLSIGSEEVASLDASARAAVAAYRRGWRTVAREVCEGSGEAAGLTEAGRGEAEDCLRLAEAQLHGAVDAAAHGDVALWPLPSAADCLMAGPSSSLPRDRDAGGATALLATYAELAEAQALRDGGQEQHARATFARAWGEGGDVATPAVAMAALHFQAETARRDDDHARASLYAGRAYELALSFGDAARAVIFASMLRSLAESQGDEAAAGLWSRHIALLRR